MAYNPDFVGKEEMERHKAVPVVEERREWEHGDEGRGKQCDRAAKPVYTDVQKRPGQCRDWHCDNDQWFNKGVVKRLKDSRKVIERDGKKVD